jgi:hypothetical protein
VNVAVLTDGLVREAVHAAEIFGARALTLFLDRPLPTDAHLIDRAGALMCTVIADRRRRIRRRIAVSIRWSTCRNQAKQDNEAHDSLQAARV